MADKKSSNDEKEEKKRKQGRKMTKILARAWDLPNSQPYQKCDKISSVGNIFDLSAIGRNLDDGVYKLGRSGWEEFARDIGGVYNRHISRKTKLATNAREHRDNICQMLAKINESLIKQATSHCPHDDSSLNARKRKSDSSSNGPSSRRRSVGKKNGEMTSVEREKKAMEDLGAYIEEVGGDRMQISTFNCRATKKSDGRFDVNFFSESRRFRSMIEVARFLTLVPDKEPPKKKIRSKKRPSNSRDAETEKRNLRKELDKLMKSHQKATKTLDDFCNEQVESQYPVDDEVLLEEYKTDDVSVSSITPFTCSAARIPDLEGFPGIPSFCLPDLLMVWDFLCTFSRALSLNPVTLEDFVMALSFKPLEEGGDFKATMHQPPVYLAEAHLALLKLLLQDVSSDDWWWSILETDEEGQGDRGEDIASAAIDYNIPVIKIDFAGLLAQEEDPLITASWLQALQTVRTAKASEGRKIKQALKTANAVVANRWVKAYLKKSLTDWKPDSAIFTKRAIIWLIDRVREARPELFGRSVNTKAMMKQRASIVDQVAILMEKMDDSGDVVAVDDFDSEEEEDSDEESDEEDINESKDLVSEEKKIDENQESAKSAIPPKPVPTLVDLLLPPGKPYVGSDMISSLTWPHLAGASVCRLLHRYKRLRNEVDDKLRDGKGLAPMSIGERRRREEESTSRVFTESVATSKFDSNVEKAANCLSKGGAYLDLGVVDRLCILKVLVDAAYDSLRVHEVVDSNYKQRFGAVKALDAEERRAKREAREEAAAADQEARKALALDARNNFIEEKRTELRKLNRRTNEYSDTVIDELTDEDIIEFDDDSKAEYAALPTPQSFNKSEVNIMVKKMQEQAAFNADTVAIITIDEIGQRDDEELRALEADLKGYVNIDVYQLGREGSRRLDRLKRDIEQIKSSTDSLPEERESAIEMLREAIEDGTVKSLKAAIRAATQAKLSGRDILTGGVWAVDILRDATLELKSAERRKRVIEAKKDLVAKMNKCFIRTEPIGKDRYRNCFWRFDNDESARVWVESQFILGEKDCVQKDGFVSLSKEINKVSHGAPEKEEDLIEPGSSIKSREAFLRFSRQEFHRRGNVPLLVSQYFGGHATERALKGLTKHLDDRGLRERGLKVNLKETLEQSGLAAVEVVTNEGGLVDSNISETATEEMQGKGLTDNVSLIRHETINGESFKKTGDEDCFKNAIDLILQSASFVFPSSLLIGITSAIGERVRVRQIVDSLKDPDLATYNLGRVISWKQHEQNKSGVEGTLEARANYPLWKVILDSGGVEVHLSGEELLESICRYKIWKSNDEKYVEQDAAIFNYRNSLGRHCGKAADAGYSATPVYLGRLMVKREQELYVSIKSLTYDNTWGGKCGARNIWIASMRDGCHDLQTVKTGLITLEDAFFQLTDGFPDSMAAPKRCAKDILDDVNMRFDVELESIEKNSTLWNSRESREVFLHIIQESSTTGFLALGLDLIIRNCWAYVNANKPTGNTRRAVSTTDTSSAPSTRSTRRMNAWQQANQDW
eukprot:CAMPEP_0194249628 /NCGR_PEP_ID=MMETSP0158-20130606/20923_1 /TAXON_ID=33649 /ORGANISM="Thalassionema nitzschioides, Strain L26-B" /LENGTH=1526 /DNA_ID=CAMNT_0038986183 /DNA_START=14 /DNA_END=4591 /DNA_ORIENTATION=-